MARLPAHRPYGLLARFYDQLQGDAPTMNRHARRKILGKILSQIHSVCDLGCGTGTTAVELARRGLRVFAVDNSPGMCRLARAKARRARLPVRVLCADMRRLRLPEPVDLVTCEFNPLNHLPRKSDLARAARAVARALRPGGYFYFDLNTRRTLEELYPSAHWIERRNLALVLHGGYDRRRQKGWLNFEWFLPAGKLWRRERERVEDIWWTDGEIRRAVRRAGFDRIRAWDAVRVRPHTPHSRPGFDMYYLARKSPVRGRKN
ncbi:MAG: class I SAM-dependent methyltransferase [Acidobacteria bacterium]|nr:class I SAM-dependent methyltransferase [Acidobacteriota bacterium]